MNSSTMRRRRGPTIAIAVVLASLMVATSGQAQTNIYVTIDGIPGEICGTSPAGWFCATSVIVGASSACNAATPGCGNTNVHDVTISKAFGSASPMLFARVLGGDLIQDASIEVWQQTGPDTSVKTAEYLLEKVVVTQVSPALAGSDQSENISLNMGKITVNHWGLTEGGEQGPLTTSCWDVLQNKPC